MGSYNNKVNKTHRMDQILKIRKVKNHDPRHQNPVEQKSIDQESKNDNNLDEVAETVKRRDILFR